MCVPVHLGEPVRSPASSLRQRAHLRLELPGLRPTRERHGQVVRLRDRLAPHVLQELHGAAGRLAGGHRAHAPLVVPQLQGKRPPATCT